uniref:Uncharacterized protein n=1 Tax=Anguilla anguilla TaxID=7936 RepID=A0A0E9VAN2_ANGAN
MFCGNRRQLKIVSVIVLEVVIAGKLTDVSVIQGECVPRFPAVLECQTCDYS